MTVANVHTKALYLPWRATKRNETHREPSTELGRVLRDLRESRSLTQKKLGETAGIDHSYVSRIESGERPGISRDTADILADALALTDMERDDFLRAAGFAPRESPEDVQFRALPTATKRALLRLVETVREEVA